jgi:hypothetical protein
MVVRSSRGRGRSPDQQAAVLRAPPRPGNDQQRFAFDPTGTRIRASQGHSVTVDLGYGAPPAELLHGTVDRSLPAILTEACSRDAATRST